MTLGLPTRGSFSKPGQMWDPHKIGNVLWARIPSGEVVPVDLHGKICDEDAQTLNKVYGRLKAYRKVRPAFQVLQERPLRDSKTILPYLYETMSGRAEAREMMATGDWEAIWSIL